MLNLQAVTDGLSTELHEATDRVNARINAMPEYYLYENKTNRQLEQVYNTIHHMPSNIEMRSLQRKVQKKHPSVHFDSRRSIESIKAALEEHDETSKSPNSRTKVGKSKSTTAAADGSTTSTVSGIGIFNRRKKTVQFGGIAEEEQNLV